MVSQTDTTYQMIPYPYSHRSLADFGEIRYTESKSNTAEYKPVSWESV
jgi:hypothetical protein